MAGEEWGRREGARFIFIFLLVHCCHQAEVSHFHYVVHGEEDVGGLQDQQLQVTSRAPHKERRQQSGLQSSTSHAAHKTNTVTHNTLIQSSLKESFSSLTEAAEFRWSHTHRQCVHVHLEVPVHKPLAVQEVDSFCNLQEDVQTLVVLPLLQQAALSHPVLQVLLPTELHLDVQVDLETGREDSPHYNFTLHS